MTFHEQLSEQVVIEIKAEMARQRVQSANELGRRIGASQQYINQRLNSGNPKTGKRVPLNIGDLGKIADALNLDVSDLIRRAEAALAAADD